MINFAAIFSPSSIEFGSTPLSNRYLASVFKDSFFDVLEILIGSNAAASNTISHVLSEIELVFPPIIPPSPSTLFLSAITHEFVGKLYSLSSSAKNLSLLLLFLTIISFFAILLRSYACIGLLRSIIIKLVISTTADIGFNPIEDKWLLSHLGLSQFFIP